MTDMFKGFKDFLLKGNIIELAVAFVMGLAIYNLVTNFVSSFIDPIVRIILGGGDTSAGGRVHLKGPYALDFGSFINALIAFIVIAAVVYFVFVVLVGKLRAKFTSPEEPAGETELDLLRQIRDGLHRG